MAAFAAGVVFITEKWSALNDPFDLTPISWIREAGKPASSRRARITRAPEPSTLVSLSPSMIASFSLEGSSKPHPTPLVQQGPIGTGAKEVWFYAAKGTPRSLVIFLHGYGGPTEETPA